MPVLLGKPLLSFRGELGSSHPDVRAIEPPTDTLPLNIRCGRARASNGVPHGLLQRAALPDRVDAEEVVALDDLGLEVVTVGGNGSRDGIVALGDRHDLLRVVLEGVREEVDAVMETHLSGHGGLDEAKKGGAGCAPPPKKK